MAYKSRVSNKYFGSTFAGRVATSNENPLTDVVKVLRTQFTPAMENYADKYIEGKKTSADTYLSGYYATGGTPEKLNEEILAGQHPELQSMYAETVIQTHNGRFQANKVIEQIELQKDSYNPFDSENPQTWTEWVSSLTDDKGNKLIPDMEGKNKGYVNGFALQFGEYRQGALEQDAVMRADYWNTKKQEAAMSFMHTNLMKMDKVNEDYWKTLQTLNSELPNESGITGKAYYFDTEELNQVALDHAAWILSTATTVEEIEKAESILRADRGIGKGGNPLGSLLSTKNKEVATLMSNLNATKTALINQGRRDKQYADEDAIKGVFVDIMTKDNLTFEDVRNAKTQLAQYGDPRLLNAVDGFYNTNRFKTSDPATIDTFFSGVLQGKYESPADMFQAMLDEGIPTDKLGTALSYYSYADENRRAGRTPVYYTDTTYVNQTNKILNVVDGSFKDAKLGTYKVEGADQAQFNANNYIIKSIVDFETNFKKDNQREPNAQERFEFMERLGKTITKIFTANPEANPPALGTAFTQIEKDIQLKQEQKEVLDTSIANQNDAFSQEVELFTALPTKPEIPVFSKEDDTFYTMSRAAEVQKFNKEKLVPAVNKAIADAFANVQNLGAIVQAMPQERFDEIVDQLATYMGVDRNFVIQSIDTFIRSQEDN
tara:strand:- start:372 stop:2354 length:1983 start_codon:yes stop_codon:yes gene_type:complete